MKAVTERRTTWLGLAFAVVLTLPASRAAAQQECPPVITSVPCVISATNPNPSKLFLLGQDVSMPESPDLAAISVLANFVTIDLNGYRISGPNTSTTRTNGIVGTAGIRNLTVRNGAVLNFWRGIVVDDNGSPGNSLGHLVERVKLFGNRWVAVWLGGRETIVRDNIVMSTGGTDYNSGGINVYGLLLYGSGARVLNNDIVNTSTSDPAGYARAIFIGNSTPYNGAIVEGNRISNGTLGANSQGIVIWDISDALVSDNRMNTLGTGLWWISSTGKYRDNLTAGVTTPYSGGTDAGNNN